MPDRFRLEDHCQLVRISDEWWAADIVLTESLAKLFIRTMLPNRRITWRHVHRMAIDILEGNYPFNPFEPMEFDVDTGRMRGGQQRCHALLLACKRRPGTTVRVAIVKCPKTAMYGQGLPQKPKDFLDTPRAALKTKVAAFLWLLERGPRAVTGSWRPTTAQILETYMAWQDLVDVSAEEIPTMGGVDFRHHCCGNYAWFIALDCIFRKIDDTNARIFRRQVVVGEGLEEGDPARTLRIRLNGLATDLKSGAKMKYHHKQPWYRMAMAILAWNAFSQDNALKRLTQSADPDTFPEIRGWLRWVSISWRPPKTRPTDLYLEMEGKLEPQAGPPQPPEDDIKKEMARRVDGTGKYCYDISRLRHVAVVTGLMTEVVAETMVRQQLVDAIKASGLSVEAFRTEVWGDHA